MPISTVDLPAGILVQFNAVQRGGCHIVHRNKVITYTENGRKQISYDGETVYDNKDEYDKGVRLAGKIKEMVDDFGVHMPFGNSVVVPMSRRAEVEALEIEAQRLVQEYNAGAAFTQLRFSSILCELTGTNAKNLEIMLDELQSGLGDLEEALRNLETGDVRKIFTSLRNYVDMIPEEAAQVLKDTLEKSKATADKMASADRKVARLQKKLATLNAGENPQETVDRLLAGDPSKLMRQTAREIQTVIDETTETLVNLEAAKAEMADVPVNLARFACARKVEVLPEVEIPLQDSSMQRFANLAAEVPTDAVNPDVN
jgi:primosomal protein N''